MNDGICFAAVDLPFHVWVRERTGTNTYRWVLREATPAGIAAPLSDRDPSPGDVAGSSS
jgi:hypothetical protein